MYGCIDDERAQLSKQARRQRSRLVQLLKRECPCSDDARTRSIALMRRRCTFDEHARRVPTTPIPEEHLRRAAEILAAANEPGRIRMLLLLAQGPAFVSDLARQLGLRPSHASQQLAVLREADLVKARRRGKQVEYALVDGHVETLVEMAVAFVSARRS